MPDAEIKIYSKDEDATRYLWYKLVTAELDEDECITPHVQYNKLERDGDYFVMTIGLGCDAGKDDIAKLIRRK